ncbi:tautomerase family protein [Aureimonas sp. SK2]|uniref:tautomerase family protein n=1 Tax=Aureimonas sp. SK2 TaxID=3015992 RepID=UPI00244518E4|nr:tautomerase family protein [Aureimonas sp. SK2]
MPFVHIRIAGPPLSPPQVEALQRGATSLLADLLRKKPELTAVLVERCEAGAWSVAGRPVPLAAHFEATITAGTNDEDEKARFVHAAHALLAEIVGAGLPPATYVVIHEVAADAWGYGGRTQLARRVSAG